MARPRFSEMLLDRRRQLGLSITQASKVLKLKEQVLIAFEEGNFDEMPQTGYAQGMLSSYARYLGLNPREIADLFQEERYEHVNGTASHELRRRTRKVQSGRDLDGYDMVNEVGSRPKAYVEYHGLLPTAGGPAGDMGAFATTSSVRSRTPNSVPLAGANRSRPDAPGSYSHAEYVYGRPYNDRSAADRQDRPGSAPDPARGARRQRGGTAQRRARSVNDPAQRLLRDGQNGVEELRQNSVGGGRGSARGYSRDDISTRRVRSGEYTDDLRYGYDARPYDRASTISGRRSSRNIADTNRPNVQRRTSGARPDGRGRQARRQPLNDNRRTILVGAAVLGLVLTLILVFSVKSCVGAKTSPERPSTVPVTSTTSGESSGSASSSRPATPVTTQGDSKDGKAEAAAAAEAEAPKQTDVKISVASGETSWVEVTNDGTSQFANTVTGPWEQTYTVTQSITIRVTNPGAVTITKNGAQVNFDSKSSGLGTVTIEGTPAPAEGAEGEGEGGGESSGSKKDSASTDSSKKTSSSSSDGSSTSGVKNAASARGTSSTGTKKNN